MINPIVSIIIVNYKNWRLTAQCVESIREANIASSFEIIVVDNHSEDGSYERLCELLSPENIVLESDANDGFSAGNNIGVASARGRYLFFLNNDTLLRSDVLDEMIAVLDNDESFGALTCRSIDGNGDYLNNGHSFPGLASLVKEVLVKPLVPPSILACLRNSRNLDESRSVTRHDWISGSALLISAALFHAIGGWDERYFMYMEDVSLCQEVSGHDRFCGVYERLGFVHFHGDAVGSLRVIYEAGRSEIMYYRKYRPSMSKIAKRFAILRAKQRAKAFGLDAKRELENALGSI